jgi:hypothetical protein
MVTRAAVERWIVLNHHTQDRSGDRLFGSPAIRRWRNFRTSDNILSCTLMIECRGQERYIGQLQASANISIETSPDLSIVSTASRPHFETLLYHKTVYHALSTPPYDA